MRSLFRQPFDDLLACLEPIVTARRPALVVMPLFVAVAVAWVLYVPIHELMHAYACRFAGGEITQLEIASRYGGAIYARYFDFVVSGGEYAGRLSGFDTKGSDWIYLATDFGPYLLTVLIGVPLLKIAGRGRRPVRFAMGIVIGLAPFYSLPGDYFEMGSIVTTRVAGTLVGDTGEPTEHGGPGHEENAPVQPGGATFANVQPSGAVYLAGIRSDDVFSLMAALISRPGELGLDTPGRIAIGGVMILISMVVGLLLALVTYQLGHWVSLLLLSPDRTPPS